MRAKLESKIYDLLTTAKPGEVAVKLHVPQEFIRADTEIPEGCLLRNLPPCRQVDDAVLKGYGDYVLTAAEDGDEGYLAYIFGKPKSITETDFEAALVRRWEDWVDVPWPDVLRVFYAMRGTVAEGTEAGTWGGNQTANTVSKNRVFERTDYVKGGVIPTRVTREIYQAPTPFAGLRAENLLTSRVRIHFEGINFSEDCLHDDVTVPEQIVDGEIVPDLGTPNPEGEDYSRGQIFPATEHTTWPDELVLQDSQRFTGRLWQRERLIAHAPEMPPPQEIPLL